MAKLTYYAIDPSSSDVLELNDSSGTPNTQVLTMTGSAQHDREVASYTGCNTAFMYTRKTSETILKFLLQIRSHVMDEVFDKIQELEVALAGNVSVPGATRLFNLIMAVDGATYYGYQKCMLVGFNPNWRAQYTIGGDEFVLKVPPVFTLVAISVKTAYPNLTEL